MDAVQKANSGHPGTPMALAPLAYVLYSQVMRHNPRNPEWCNRDRFILCAGHASMLLYSSLLPRRLRRLARRHQVFPAVGQQECPGHPEYGHKTPGDRDLDRSAGTGRRQRGRLRARRGSSGRQLQPSRRRTESSTTTPSSSAGDGDMEEGISSEAASLAGNLGLGKLIAIYDDNEIQIEGSTHPRLPRQGPRRSASSPTAGRSTAADDRLDPRRRSHASPSRRPGP